MRIGIVLVFLIAIFAFVAPTAMDAVVELNNPFPDNGVKEIHVFDEEEATDDENKQATGEDGQAVDEEADSAEQEALNEQNQDDPSLKEEKSNPFAEQDLQKWEGDDR